MQKLIGKTEKQIKCQVCGKWYKKLTFRHLARHNLTIKGYKKRFGLPRSFALEAGYVGQLRSSANKKKKCYLNLKKGKKTRFRKGYRLVGGKFIPVKSKFTRVKQK